MIRVGGFRDGEEGFATGEEGEGHLREALQIAPQTLSYHGMLAVALRQQGRTQEADEEVHLEAGVRKTFIQENPR